MLIQQNVLALKSLRQSGMASAYAARASDPEFIKLSIDEAVSLLIDAQTHDNEQRRYKRLMKDAKLKLSGACVEGIDYTADRGLNRSVITALNSLEWVDRAQNLITVGITGTGKSYLACAYAHQCIRRGWPVMYRRLSRMLEEMEIARADGSLAKLRLRISKYKLLVLDDLGVSPISARGREDLLEIIEDRLGESSIAITSQLPIDRWHDWLGEPTIADAILDRLVHSAHIINLHGESMRKRLSITTEAK